MRLSFLPDEVQYALENVNLNFLSEIRLRRGQPVIVEYKGEYKYLNSYGVSETARGGIIAGDLAEVVNRAVGGCIYGYSEQMKSGFITVSHGIRIGLAGEYVTQNGEVLSIRNITSLNVRIPHNVVNCALYIYQNLFFDCLHSTLLYSKPGLGKTTMLRDLAIHVGTHTKNNVLVFDERNEIAAIDNEGNGFDLGDSVDVIRCYNKRSAIAGAIRAMKPDLIITDELYGEDDVKAMRYAADCGIKIIASSHVCAKEILKAMPFEFYAELRGIGKQPVIYDKNFNTYCRDGSDDVTGDIPLGK